ncbi:hypothetical protein GCM10009804_45450 [Kribbella hippodromi]|uniref:HNH endonuclease n=1 Tax=Kribbella hippodromi TaxID=434347 RepID=A0ABN2DU69_9ACTN
MNLPPWQDDSLGTMKRVALWLIQVVGEGNDFTKEALRADFPSVSQIDRRMRDLRDFGWRIDTNREDPALGAHQQRFVTQGDPVWEPGRAGKRSKRSTAIGAGLRRQVLSADGHMCRSCGITPGDTYAGGYETAQLDIARREVLRPDGSVEIELITECNRCRVGGRDLTADRGAVLANVSALSGAERRVLAGWVNADAREFSRLERIWSEYRTLPEPSRTAVRQELGLD